MGWIANYFAITIDIDGATEKEVAYESMCELRTK